MSTGATGAPSAWVYRSRRHAELYVFLAREEDWECVPEAMRQRIGRTELVMEVALTPGRTLARSDPAKVREALARQGYFVQLPPEFNPRLLFGD